MHALTFYEQTKLKIQNYTEHKLIPYYSRGKALVAFALLSAT